MQRVPPSPTTTHRREAPEDSEIFSDIVLTYISQMLMEEDDEEKLDVLQEHPALLAAEKGFYDIIAGYKSSSSSSPPDYSLPTSNHSYNSSDDSLSPQERNTNVSGSLADCRVTVSSTAHKNSHISVDDLEAEQGRTFKQSFLYFDTDILSEMFDTLLYEECKANAVDDQTDSGKVRRRKREGRKGLVDLNFLLLQCAEALSNNDSYRANSILNKIRQSSSPFGDAEQRVAHYFSDALEARLTGGMGSRSSSFPASVRAMVDMLKAYRLYISTSPFKKISDFFVHQTILNAVEQAGKLHIVDFGINHGFMWPCFMQRLSTLPGGPPHLRITAVDLPHPGFRPSERIEDTGRRLTGYASRFSIPFEYHFFACKWEEIQPEEFGIKEDEVVAVTCMYRLHNLADETLSPRSPRDQVLSTIRKLNPKVFVTGIVNGTYNSPFFLARFKEALFHFSALFDMMEMNASRESEERRLLEKHWFEKEVLNVVACEGLERTERPETYKQWRLRNERAGLEQLPLDSEIARKAREKVKGCYHKDFLVDEDGRWLLLGWKGRIVCALSSWKARQA